MSKLWEAKNVNAAFGNIATSAFYTEYTTTINNWFLDEIVVVLIDFGTLK